MGDYQIDKEDDKIPNGDDKKGMEMTRKERRRQKREEDNQIQKKDDQN